MRVINRICLIGRLVRDPELRYSASGVAIVNFTLAVDRRFKNANGEKETDFINVKAFKQLAEMVANYCSKGKLVGVSGSLQTGSYMAQDGQKRFTVDVLADEVQFLSPKEATTASNEGANSPCGKEVDPNDPNYIPF